MAMCGQNGYSDAISNWLSSLADILSIKIGAVELQLAETIKLSENLSINVHLVERPSLQVILDAHRDENPSPLVLSASADSESPSNRPILTSQSMPSEPEDGPAPKRYDHYFFDQYFLERKSRFIHKNIHVSSLIYGEEKLVQYLHIQDRPAHFQIEIENNSGIKHWPYIGSDYRIYSRNSRKRAVKKNYWFFEKRDPSTILSIDGSSPIYFSFDQGIVDSVFYFTFWRNSFEPYHYIFLMANNQVAI